MGDQHRIKRFGFSKPERKLVSSQSYYYKSYGGHNARSRRFSTFMVRLNDSTVENNRSESKHLELNLVREIPNQVKVGAIEGAITAFITDAMIDTDPQGFFNQTIERVAMATFLNVGGLGSFLAG